MGPPSYMQSVVDRNVVMGRMTVFELLNVEMPTIRSSLDDLRVKW
jgi:hypothetical protein